MKFNKIKALFCKYDLSLSEWRAITFAKEIGNFKKKFIQIFA